jgi:hypothetical protein
MGSEWAAASRAMVRCENVVVRVIARVAFVLFASAFLGLAYGTLSHLWGYQDSSTQFYVGVGSVWIAAASACLFIAIRSLRGR